MALKENLMGTVGEQIETDGYKPQIIEHVGFLSSLLLPTDKTQ